MGKSEIANRKLRRTSEEKWERKEKKRAMIRLDCAHMMPVSDGPSRLQRGDPLLQSFLKFPCILFGFYQMRVEVSLTEWADCNYLHFYGSGFSLSTTFTSIGEVRAILGYPVDDRI